MEKMIGRNLEVILVLRRLLESDADGAAWSHFAKFKRGFGPIKSLQMMLNRVGLVKKRYSGISCSKVWTTKANANEESDAMIVM